MSENRRADGWRVIYGPEIPAGKFAGFEWPHSEFAIEFSEDAKSDMTKPGIDKSLDNRPNTKPRREDEK